MVARVASKISFVFGVGVASLFVLRFGYLLTWKSSMSRTSTTSPVALLAGKDFLGNNVSNSRCQVLFFNRVPKTGSEMMALLLQWMQARNDFQLIRLRGNDQRRLTQQEQNELANEIATTVQRAPPGTKLAFDRHLYFLDVQRLAQIPSDAADIVYFSVIRDPIEKAASRFYYKRATVSSTAVDPGEKQEKAEESFDDCVRSAKAGCTFIQGEKYDLAVPYFCGHEPDCMILGNPWALKKAVQNVEKHYPVVGVLEQLNETLLALEKGIPEFFSGVQEVFFHELQQPKWNWNKERPRKLSQDVVNSLRQNLSMEFEFYNFVKWRLLHARL